MNVIKLVQEYLANELIKHGYNVDIKPSLFNIYIRRPIQAHMAPIAIVYLSTSTSYVTIEHCKYDLPSTPQIHYITLESPTAFQDIIDHILETSPL